MSVLRALLAALLLAPVLTLQAATPWRATVTHVTDGDTLWVRPAAGGRPVKLRLDGIDAPEICQAHGPAARRALAQRLQGRQFAIDTRRRDDYGRLVATVYLEGEDVAGWMVGQGHAWSYRFRRDDGPYRTQQLRAQAAARGLFADPAALEPRLFRRRHGTCHVNSGER